MICIPNQTPACKPRRPQPPPPEPSHWVATCIVEITTRRSAAGIKSGRPEYQAHVRVANAAGRQAVVPCRYKQIATFGPFQTHLLVKHQIFFAPGRFRGTGSRAAWDAELEKHLTPPANACVLRGAPGDLIALNGRVFWLCDDHPRTPENEAAVMQLLGEDHVVVVTDPGFYERGGDAA